MKPYIHQEQGAQEAYAILQKYGLVYVAWEERCGKSLTSLLIAERSKAVNILILTKKKAIDGWRETLCGYFGLKSLRPLRSGDGGSASAHNKKYTVTNYHQAVKLSKVYDLIILDEAHSYLSASPKTGKLWKDVAVLARGKPLIYMSATPYAQGYRLLFHQFKLSSWSPWAAYKNFYDWHRKWGIPDKTRTPYGLIETYAKVDSAVMATCEHLFITKTRAELKFEHEPEDVIHFYELTESTKKIYNTLIKDQVVMLGEHELVCDSPMKLRTSLHMLEGGVAKVEDEYLVLDNREKIDAIQKDFEDTSNLAIMYNYIAEGTRLRKEFKHAIILQGTSFAEGVDLSGIENLVIYSQDFSTARHSQRRARQANKKRRTPINVHFYLVKDSVGEQVYETVSVNKTNFIDKLFNRKEL